MSTSELRTDRGRVAELATLLRESERAAALTGAGVSVPSGIPDFRTPGTGLWENVNPMEVAHVDAFRRDPDRFWSFYGERFASLTDKRPNPAHEELAALERDGILRGVMTQNVDRLHRRAGSANVVELHGSIDWSVCMECGGTRVARPGARDAAPRARSARVRGLHRPAQARRRAVRRDAARRGDGGGHRARVGGGPPALRRVVARGLSRLRRFPPLTLEHGGQLAIVTQGPTPYDRDAAVKLEGDVASELEALGAALRT